jgi:hypothetical protein
MVAKLSVESWTSNVESSIQAHMPDAPAFHHPVLQHARRDAPLLSIDMTVDQALQFIREKGIEERTIYSSSVRCSAWLAAAPSFWSPGSGVDRPRRRR